MQPLIDFFGANGFLPHGYCLTWSSGLLWLHVVSDALIVLAYYSIPLTLVYFVRQRKDLPYPWLFVMFGLFIVACGTTHLLSVITVWIPLYWLDGIVKAVTAVISVVAALMMFRVVPRALMLRSPAQLEVEVQESKQAQKALQTILDNAPVGIWLVGVDKRYRFVNKTFCDAVGIAESRFLAATHLPDLLGTEIAANCMKSDQECLAKETPHISYEELIFVDGKQHLMEITKVKLRDSAGVTTGAIGIAIDITERKRAEALERKQFNGLQAVYLVGNAIRGAESPDQVYEKAMESILRILKADRVSILLFDAEGVMRFVAWRGLSDAYREAAGGHSPWARDTVDPQPVLVDDIGLDADWAHFLPMARAEGISAFGFIPLVLHGHLLGKFMVYFNQPHRFTEDEARLAQTIASYISLTTESKKAEAELLLRAQLLDSVSDTIFLLDLDGKFVYLNEAAWKTRGYTRDEMMGISLHVLDTPKYAKLIADRFREIMEKGQCIFESEHRRKDGSVMPVEINARTIELGGHKRLLSIIRDITERKQVEGILSESEERYRALFEQGADPIWLLDAQTGAIVDFNTTAHESLGYTREEFARLSISDMEVIESPEDTALHIEKIKAQGSDVFETIHRTKYGELRYILVSVKTVTFGGATYLQCIQRDITERKEFEEKLKHSNIDLEQFAYAASHDMRQPLRMISSYLQLLESDLAPVLTDETRQNLQFATEGAKRMDQMLMALLDYSRIGRKADTMAVIDSREVMNEALRYLEPAIEEARAEVRIEGVWPRLFASRDEILRLFQNLVDNALKYRLAGQKPEVAVSAQIVGGEWRLKVRDNGVGLLPGHETRLFKVFERLQPRSRYPGTGIGLALCRKIVEHHKGRIWAESPGENQGCTFIVTLPVSLPSSLGGA